MLRGPGTARPPISAGQCLADGGAWPKAEPNQPAACWVVGGHGLISTVGGYVEQFARRGGAVPVLVALAATMAKVAGGLLALALVRPWGRRIPRRWLLMGSSVASVLLVVYGGLNVVAGALVLLDVIR